MELYQLRAFATIAREGNLSRAAKILCASQPAVSAQIRALEDEFGVALFERLPRGMEPTPEGLALLGRAQSILDAADQIAAEARCLRGEPAGTLRIGALPDPERLRLGAFLREVGLRHPALRIDLRHASSGEVRRSILDGALDAGFILGPSEERLDRFPLAPVRLAVILPPRGVVSDAPWDSVADLPWIGTTDGCPFQILGQELFERLGRAPSMGMRVDIERTILEMVSSGLGAGLMREDAAILAEREERCVVWKGAAIETGFAFVWPRSRSRNPSLGAVRAILSAMWPPS